MLFPFLYWFSQVFYFFSANFDILKIFLGIYPLHTVFQVHYHCSHTKITI